MWKSAVETMTIGLIDRCDRAISLIGATALSQGNVNRDLIWIMQGRATSPRPVEAAEDGGSAITIRLQHRSLPGAIHLPDDRVTPLG
jgi:hypothetical protein